MPTPLKIALTPPRTATNRVLIYSLAKSYSRLNYNPGVLTKGTSLFLGYGLVKHSFWGFKGVARYPFTWANKI